MVAAACVRSIIDVWAEAVIVRSMKDVVPSRRVVSVIV